VRALLAMLDALSNQPFDKGSKEFQPSNLEVTSIDVGNPTFNVTPAEAQARFNVRFNDKHTLARLKKLIERRLKNAAKGARYRIDYEPASESYLTQRGAFADLVIKAIQEAAGVKAALSTSGGTSDARFVKNYCPVVDLGLVGQTMHQIDECAPIKDLRLLTAIYRRVLELYFERAPAS
ncbi:MAG: M20/M25/M40 family metallo-hydrolase, partial [Xanthobacteraceae bacterium]|nr:M20/M25/M40 family metallo-hydrolase [Xanthobacteraceae bacterium]